MKLYWLRLLLLSTFAFWATGAAKYTHEALEHHGRDASVDDDDDDDSSAPLAAITQPPVDPSHQQPVKQKHACPVCQMLAGMVADRSAPPTLPPLVGPLIETLVISDHIAPVVQIRFTASARGPPVESSSI
jgi:hypothetical protein